MGGRESQRLIVPSKRGNQTEGPRRGKEVPSHEPLKGNMPGTLRPEPCPRNNNGSRGSRIHEMRNRVRVMCKPGSVGGRGGQPPRSTRPVAAPAIWAPQARSPFPAPSVGLLRPCDPFGTKADAVGFPAWRHSREAFLVVHGFVQLDTQFRDCTVFILGVASPSDQSMPPDSSDSATWPVLANSRPAVGGSHTVAWSPQGATPRAGFPPEEHEESGNRLSIPFPFHSTLPHLLNLLVAGLIAVCSPCSQFRLGSSCVSGGYKLEFAAIAFTARTYKEVAGVEEIPPQVSVTQEFRVILAN